MKKKSVSRREFLSDAALMTLAVCLSGCTRTVTKYRPDGTPYTEEKEDPLLTLAGVILVLLIVGAVAASRNKSSSSRNDKNDRKDSPEDEGEIQFASVNSKRAWPVRNANYGVSIKDSEGKLLAITDKDERIKHHDFEAIANILASANISNLDQPVLIRLKQEKSNSYCVEQISPVQKPSGNDSSIVLKRLVKGKPYIIKVYSDREDCLDIEIASKVLGDLSVA